MATVSLPFTPIRDGYSTVPTYPVVEAQYDGGAVNKRLDPLFFPHEVNLNFKLVSPQQYTAFMGFFRTTLLDATEFFLMDLVTDIGALIPHRCRTKGGMPKLDQVSGNCFYTSCVVEVEVNPTWTGNILYTGPDSVTFTHDHPTFVGPIQPGDTIQIFNSSGTHPGTSPDWTFDGVDDIIQMGDVLDMTRTTPRSIFAWYSTTDTGFWIISKDSAFTAAGWRFVIDDSGAQDFVLHGVSGGGQLLEVGATTRPPLDGTEHFYGCTYDGSSDGSGVTIYLDGSSVPVTIGTNDLVSASTTNSLSLNLGERQTGEITTFSGTLRHVSVWNRELTPLEVTQLYNGGTPPNLLGLSFFSDCIGWWKIDPTDSNATNGVIDHSTSGNDGSALNGLGDNVLTGEVEVNLDGIYEVEAVFPNNEIQLVDPETVNADWLLLSTLGSYGSEALGDVTSTLTRHPRNP